MTIYPWGIQSARMSDFQCDRVQYSFWILIPTFQLNVSNIIEIIVRLCDGSCHFVDYQIFLLTFWKQKSFQETMNLTIRTEGRWL